MKQYNFELTKISNIKKILTNIQESLKEDSYSTLLFHLYTSEFNDEQISLVQKEIMSFFPEAHICGTSTNGDIYQGNLSDTGMVIACSAFETTEVNVQLFNCLPYQETTIGEQIREAIDNTDNIKAAEIIITLKSINSHTILNAAEMFTKDIPVFGGGSADAEISGKVTKAFTNDSISHNGVVLVTYCGDDLVVDVHHSIGWKPLGKNFQVTKIIGKELYELNNIPAGQVYKNYLDIEADDDFFSNILEFPIMSYQHGYEVLRLPFACNEKDLSITLAAEIDKGTPVNLSYGDPKVIQDDVAKLTKHVKDFAPQAIFLVTCGVRKLYWKYLINKETSPFANIAPVAGFYSSGEIMNMGDYLIEHHVTLIAVSMREGGKAAAQPTSEGDKSLPMSEEQKMHSQISMVRRLANFINVTSAELHEANQQLKELAETDELTGLYNRRMIRKLVADAVHRANKCNNIDMVVGIIDIDHFKDVNDTYGHSTGDMVLKVLSEAMLNEVEQLPSGVFGRWGGEEFVFLAPTFTLTEEAFKTIEAARQRISSIPIYHVGPKTISIGVTAYKTGDTVESLFERADAALYEAKETGRNKTCRK